MLSSTQGVSHSSQTAPRAARGGEQRPCELHESSTDRDRPERACTESRRLILLIVNANVNASACDDGHPLARDILRT